jgi:hypothetical protein
VNGNGRLDSGDLQAQTGADGGYSFTGIAPGTYKVYEVYPAAGWRCSEPSPCSYDITFGAGDHVTGKDFGNWAHALLRGHKYEDANRDGIHQASESPLGGWTIYVDYNNNGKLDPGEPHSVTLPNGYYGITGIAAGTWTVREVSQPDWTCSGPSPCSYNLTFAPQSEIEGKNFLNWAPARVAGNVWNDLEADTFKDPGEPGLENWVVYVDYNDDGKLDPGDISTITNSSGDYSMGVKPGTWTVREILVDRWVCDSPNPCDHSLTFTSGSTKAGDFGNYKLATLSGKMFDDLNRNSKQDPGDPGLGGWRVYVDYNNNGKWDPGEPTDVTSAGTGKPSAGSRRLTSTRSQPGHYTITGIDPGTWTIREVQKNGYPCILPFTCEYKQKFLPASRIDHADFATFKPILHGKARLSAPDSCVKKTFTVRVTGRFIRRVVVTVGHAVHRVPSGRHLTGRKRLWQVFVVRINANRMNSGVHHIVAHVYFKSASHTKPKRLVRVFYRCARATPPFTG